MWEETGVSCHTCGHEYQKVCMQAGCVALSRADGKHADAGHKHEASKLDCCLTPSDAHVICGSEDGVPLSSLLQPICAALSIFFYKAALLCQFVFGALVMTIICLHHCTYLVAKSSIP